MLKYVPRACFPQPVSNPIDLMGLHFPHRIGLAAGLDKNGAYLDVLAKFGFAFIEIGTVTPRAQNGNPQPRLFRLSKANALINRMGFNNQGVDALIRNIRHAEYRGILGINIGKNKDTPLNQAGNDYVFCLQRVYPYASYVTVNISSPNTPDLRQLHQAGYFEHLIDDLQTARLRLQDQHGRNVPLVIKVSPDESESTLKRMMDVMLVQHIDGVIATNTTADRCAVSGLPYGNEEGGLSGSPLFERSTTTLRLIKEAVGEDMVLIGVGGIDSCAAAAEKFKAGASLLQVYTGLIYQGPALVRDLARQCP
jgi:dihydroorotate dehydrogenase